MVKTVLSADNNNWPEVVRNLKKACRNWARLTQVFIREGEYAWTLVQIYLAVVQSVLLYGSDTWVATPPIGRVLGRFHHKVTHSMTGGGNRIGRDRIWV